jgi:hypothetical protein
VVEKRVKSLQLTLHLLQVAVLHSMILSRSD